MKKELQCGNRRGRYELAAVVITMIWTDEYEKGEELI